MNLKEIQELIRFVSKAGVTEVELAQGDFKITIKTQSEEERNLIQKLSSMSVQPQMQYVSAPMQQAPQQSQAQSSNHSSNQVDVAAPTVAPVESIPASTTVPINSPMIGTFYRKPSPDKPLFINVGDKVSKGQVVCIIEAMKLFNEIESEVSGTIVKAVADDTSPVEYGQVLFLVQPD